MTLLEMKKKALGLIEELNPESQYLTDDVDIQTKINEVINQVMFELARLKKIPRYVELPVSAGDVVRFADISAACGMEVFQLGRIGGAACDLRAHGTVLKVKESGMLEIDCFVYPERITEKTVDKAYEFELSQDALEIMPYGIAADLLKSDVSTDYGAAYKDRYETMLQRLDSRYVMPGIHIEGGVDI